jgi:thiamine biosynthesis lipoprotein
VFVDLSAIAKGFGVDQVAEVLGRHAIHNFMVEIGGEVRAEGVKPDGTHWRIGIETPTPYSRGIQRAVELRGQSLATSGDYRNFVVIDGIRYSHTIDPKTGWPVVHHLTSASVIAENCTLADAYATALMVLGPDEGYTWATEEGIAALLMIRKGDQIIEKPTPEFENLFPAEDDAFTMANGLIIAGAFLMVLLVISAGLVFKKRCIAGSCERLSRKTE